MYDYLCGKVGSVRASQGDLLRWTRQVAEAVVAMPGVQGCNDLTVLSAKSVFLVPASEVSSRGRDDKRILDARVNMACDSTSSADSHRDDGSFVIMT